MQDIKQQEEINKRFDELCDTLGIKEFLDMEFDRKLKSFIQSEISLAVEQEKERTREILKQIGMDDSFDNMIFSLSSGREFGTKKLLERYEALINNK